MSKLKCSNCGSYIEEDAKFCSECGAKFNEELIATKVVEDSNTSEKYNGMAIAGFVVSLCALVINFFGVVGAIGTVLSAIALSQTSKTKEKGRGLAIAGLVVGIVSIVLGLLGLLALMSIGSMFDYFTSLY